VFATASPAKHAYLRAHGVRHVFHSRTLAFADEIRAATGGEGVDVVLNSLAGEFVDASLACLKDGGRFVEIGKLGVKTPEEMAAARPDVEYFLFDLSDTLTAHPEILPELRRSLASGFADGAFTALPTTSFAAPRAVEAFRALAQARQIGKIALVMPAGAASARPEVRGDRTYLVTGGLGALGRVVARRLVADGARHVVLCGRRGLEAASDDARRDVEALRADGADVRCVAADLAERDAAERVLADIAADMPPLAGVVHCAGVLDDATVMQLDLERIERVLAPKVAGARNLHELTRDLPLDLFVVFSSIAAPLGAQGQAAYGAANAALDALCARRRSEGLPALSIQWGPWSGGGMASGLSSRDQVRLAERGLGAIAPADGAALFAQALRLDRSEVAVLPVHWPKFLKAYPRGGPPPFLSAFASAADPAAGEEPDGLRGELEAAAPEDRVAVLAELLERQLVRVLGFPPSTTIDPRKGFSDLGVDSLLAVDLRNRLETALDVALPATLLFDHPNLEALVGYLAGEVLPDVAPAARVPAPDAAAELAELSDDEIAQRLAAEIDALSAE
jgi:NADP-dependent 3-hydroxy acid dehydrogenase YdfG/acyl carrier protein